jgi:hypothetical protein
MRRFVRYSSFAVVLSMWSGTVHAQYGGYGGYGGDGGGWGGWGGSSTVAGSIGRGLGMFGVGAGIYNRDTAQARSMNMNTYLRWNQAVDNGQQVMKRRYIERQREHMKENNEAYTDIQDRIRNHPTSRDITDGDALNALLDVLLNPAAADQSIQLVKTPLRAETIANIPFEVASEGMTVCLDSMTQDGQWPLLLRDEIFKSEREGLRKAVKKALKEDETGDLEPETIDGVQKAIKALRLKFVKQVPLQNTSDYIEAQNTIKAMSGLIAMLDSSKIEKVLAELEDYQGTTLGDLLAFMQAFNLRFGVANSYRQRMIYNKLYPMLAEQANGTLGNLSGGVTAVANQAAGAVQNLGNQAVTATESAGSELKSAAMSLFKDLPWER